MDWVLETITEAGLTEMKFLWKILASVTSTHLNGSINHQNCYSDRYRKPTFMQGSATQYPEKIWAAILGDSVIGPLFIKQNLNDPLYLNLLQNYITLNQWKYWKSTKWTRQLSNR